MPRRFQFCLYLLLLWGPVASSATDITRFAGQWRGVAIEDNVGYEITAKDLSLSFRPAEGGFELEWTTPEGEREQALFKEAESQPGVFPVQVEKGGILGLFSSEGETNPLNGDPLVWARTNGDMFVVYKLVIDEQGAFRLDRYESRLQDGALRFYFSRRSHGEPETSFVARLERAEG